MNRREAGGSAAASKPVAPPMMLPSGSNTTPESSTNWIVLRGLSFCTSPSIEPANAGSNELGSTRMKEMPGFGCGASDLDDDLEAGNRRAGREAQLAAGRVLAVRGDVADAHRHRADQPIVR